MSTPLMEVRGLRKEYPVRKGFPIQRTVSTVHAVDGVDLEVNEGETLGIVGESGCGKSTTARLMLRLIEPTAGEILWRGHNIAGYTRKQMIPLRREMQMIFQDPYSSLNPRKTIGSIIAEPFLIHGLASDVDAAKPRVQELMERVGLNPEHFNRLPHQFSGGQRQRIGVARALAVDPKLIIADEPVSALDVSIQAQILGLLRELQRDLGLTMIFISHDLSVVRHMCNRVAVMNAGRVVEAAPAEELYSSPQHEYTKTLLAAVPIADPVAARERREAGGAAGA